MKARHYGRPLSDGEYELFLGAINPGASIDPALGVRPNLALGGACPHFCPRIFKESSLKSRNHLMYAATRSEEQTQCNTIRDKACQRVFD